MVAPGVADVSVTVCALLKIPPGGVAIGVATVPILPPPPPCCENTAVVTLLGSALIALAKKFSVVPSATVIGVV